MRTMILTVILLCCLMTTSTQAQTTVSSFGETTDFIPGDDQRRDYNNQMCALIKVQVLDDIAEVEGNIMGDIVNRGVEKWVYMAQGSRNMKIHLKNNLPVTIKFKDYGVISLQGNRVYSLVLNAPNQLKVNENIKGNHLQMRISPANANVTIWGDNLQKRVYRPDDDGYLNVYLPYGRYHYSVSANGYSNKDGSLFVNDENSLQTVELSHETQSISEQEQVIQPKENSPQKVKIKKPSPFDIEHKVVFGVRAGANLAWTQFEKEYGNAGMAPSFYAGLCMEVPITKVFYFNTALLYSNKGYKYEDGPLVEKGNAQYIDLPLQLSVRFGDAEKLQFQVNAGPYVAMGIGGKVKVEDEDTEQNFFDYYNSFDYGLAIGAGISISKHFYVGANFQLGLAKYRNRNISLGVGYNF